MPLGNRVFRQIERPAADVVAALGHYHSADLADAMNKHGAISTDIRPLYAPMRKLVGVAITASLPTGSFSMGRIAMDLLQQGDVLVMNAFADPAHAMFGGHLAHAVSVRGAAGVIVDGAVRDVSELQDLDLPVYARSTAVVVGGHDGPGEINVPVACGGSVVNPGDILVGDADGLVAIPREHATEVLEAVQGLKERHAASDPTFASGQIPGLADMVQRSMASGCDYL